MENYWTVKKKWIIDACSNVSESCKHYAKWKKPDAKDYILYDSIYSKYPECKLVVRDRSADWLQMDTRELFRVMKMFFNWVVVMILWLCKVLKKVLGCTCTKYLTFKLYILYLNKDNENFKSKV